MRRTPRLPFTMRFEVVVAPPDRPFVPGEVGDLLNELDGLRQAVARTFGEGHALFIRIDTAMCGARWPTGDAWVQAMREALAETVPMLHDGCGLPAAEGDR